MTSILRRDDGFVGGVEAVILGVLTFVTGGLIILNAWTLIDAANALDGAAQAAARVYVEAAPGSDPLDQSTRAARESLQLYGISDSDTATVEITGSLQRCVAITVTVSYSVPRVSVPLINSLGGNRTLSARHTEIVDPFRSGLDGEIGSGCGS